jgi:hypothetical protein
MSVGMSKATDRPVWPRSSSTRNRSFVSRGVPYPANWRIVHSRPRYIDAYAPRVNGYSPGRPIDRSGPDPAVSSAV